jgi:hypothetical protein
MNIQLNGLPIDRDFILLFIILIFWALTLNLHIWNIQSPKVHRYLEML